MGSAAKKVQAARGSKRPMLRVVPPAPSSGSTRAARQQELTARRNFRMFALLVTTIASLGMARVWLSVQATEACLAADQLRADIRDERYEGDLLEVRQSALGSPERIRTIAGKALGMTTARSVSYLEIRSRRPAEASESKPGTNRVASRFGRALTDVLDLTAGEAEVLLVGDVGLASSR